MMNGCWPRTNTSLTQQYQISLIRFCSTCTSWKVISVVVEVSNVPQSEGRFDHDSARTKVHVVHSTPKRYSFSVFRGSVDS
jgi:hypothetical protein